MTDKLNNAKEFFKTNLKWFIVIIFGIIMVYLDSKYQSNEKADLSEFRQNGK
jgi:predicted negative regulator of RcsB-dependent stress response